LLSILPMLAKSLIVKVSNLSLRAWILVVGIFLTLFPAQISTWFSSLNQGLFVASSYFVEAPKGGANIGVIRVPDAELRQWQQDINSAGKLGGLLTNILYSADTTVGLLLPTTFDLGEGIADSLLQRIASSSNDSELISEAEELVARKQLLLDTLRHRQVVVASLGGIQAGQKPLLVENGSLNRLPSTVLSWFWPVQGAQRVIPLREQPRTGLEQYPLFPAEGYQRALALESQPEQVYGDFIAYFFYAMTKNTGELGEQALRTFVWQRDRGLTIGDREIATSPAATYWAYTAVSDRLKPLFNEMSLDEALKRAAFPDYVLIASETSQEVYGVANAVYSVLNGKTAHQPWWFVLLSATLSLVVTLLVVLLVPRMSFAAGVLMVMLVLVLLLVCQLVFAATRGLWLPMATQGVWLLIAFFLVRIWLDKHVRWQAMLKLTDDAGIVLASHQLNKGLLDEVQPILDNCSKSKVVLQQYYDLASAYAAKRQYRQAIDVLQCLQHKSKDYKDTEQKIQALQSMVATPDTSALHAADVDATVVIDQPAVERPVLGRYEIRRELGRGAMGTVYLGFDPRIARQVAVKTLTYSQFQAGQLDDIKSRFFREAEAAGRLSHPNIVSVYDVGEEADLAFIAMDYVEGKPLSAFVDSTCLLPVFQVYRIMADVAAALEYAHGNHIVHRDIKPGNIMYNPSPYQVKVTDFGIARLVDDSKTSTGEILGSPLYMSPEQLKGKRVNHAADVFSLGITFYQLLTGKLPFAGDNLASLTYEIIHGKHRGVRTLRKDLPSSASRITNQCLQKHAEDRYESAGELALVLKKAIKRDFAHEAKKSGYL